MHEDNILTVRELQIKYQWTEHPLYPRYMWREAVVDDDTLLGYWVWVEHRLSSEGY